MEACWWWGCGYVILISRSMGKGGTVGLYTTCMSLVSFPFISFRFFTHVHSIRELALCLEGVREVGFWDVMLVNPFPCIYGSSSLGLPKKNTHKQLLEKVQREGESNPAHLQQKAKLQSLQTKRLSIPSLCTARKVHVGPDFNSPSPTPRRPVRFDIMSNVPGCLLPELDIRKE